MEEGLTHYDDRAIETPGFAQSFDEPYVPYARR